MMITKSPVSTLGVNVGLFFPRKMLAATAERRPNGTSVASITTQLRSVVLAFAINVVRTIISSKFFLVFLRIEFNGAQWWFILLEYRVIPLLTVKNLSDNYLANADLACSAKTVNAAASLTAKSANILRFISIPANFKPCINLL